MQEKSNLYNRFSGNTSLYKIIPSNMSVHYKKEELRQSKKMYNQKKGENSYFSRREPRKYFIIGSRNIKIKLAHHHTPVSQLLLLFHLLKMLQDGFQLRLDVGIGISIGCGAHNPQIIIFENGPTIVHHFLSTDFIEEIVIR